MGWYLDRIAELEKNLDFWIHEYDREHALLLEFREHYVENTKNIEDLLRELQRVKERYENHHRH